MKVYFPQNLSVPLNIAPLRFLAVYNNAHVHCIGLESIWDIIADTPVVHV